jgi:hypothetical protein
MLRSRAALLRQVFGGQASEYQLSSLHTIYNTTLMVIDCQGEKDKWIVVSGQWSVRTPETGAGRLAQPRKPFVPQVRDQGRPFDAPQGRQERKAAPHAHAAPLAKVHWGEPASTVFQSALAWRSLSTSDVLKDFIPKAIAYSDRSDRNTWSYSKA